VSLCLCLLPVSTSCTTSARNRDAKLGEDGFGVGKQAGIKLDFLCKVFISKILINGFSFFNNLIYCT